MMKLKEAFRYQNVLNAWIGKIESYLDNNQQVLYQIKETHRISAALKDAEDEVFVNQDRKENDVEGNLCINTLVDLYTEKIALTQAIGRVKQANAPAADYDVMIEQNILRKNLIQYMERLAKCTSSSYKSQETGYTFVKEYNQVPYKYPVETIWTIDFDRDHVKSVLRKFRKEQEQVSDIIETMKLTTEVDFEPKYDTSETIEDLLTRLSGA